MKIFLKEDVKSLGKMGEVVNVAEGYARNYLIPQKMAVEANTKNVKEFEHQKRVIKEKVDKVRDASKAVAEKLSTLTLTIKAKAGEEEKLFGSVTTMDIAEALQSAGYDIDKKKVHLDEPIKRLGTFTAEVKIHPEITAKVTVQVTPDDEVTPQ
jgi:large subunit ribosomal protein L9